MIIVGIVIGIMIGSPIGMLLTALCVVAGREDERNNTDDYTT